MERRTLAGRYELQERLGSGWRARDLELEREVLVRPADDVTSAAALLDHPNVARVFDQGEADGERFVVLEYLSGGSLEERLPGLDERGARAVAGGIAAALAHAHARGVVHGSLGADSVFLDPEGHPKVTGFSATGDPAADVKAFGAILTRLAAAAPALGPIAADALAGNLGSRALADEIRAAPPAAPADVDEPTQVLPRQRGHRRRSGPLALAAAVALLAAGLGVAVLLGSDDSTSADTSGSVSVPAPSVPAATETPPSSAPPTTTTTERTETTAPPATTAAPPTEATTDPTATTAATEPPPATTEEPPPPSTDVPPTEPPSTTVSDPTTTAP